MNWFLLLLILKCLHATWAAPIDFEDITTEDLSEATTTNNLFELVENTTVNVSEFLNLTSKVQQEENRSEITTEQSTEVNTETEFPNFGIQASHSTENVPKERNFSIENVSQAPLKNFQTSGPSENTKNDFTHPVEATTKAGSAADNFGILPTTSTPETEEFKSFLNTETILSKAVSFEENKSQDLQKPTETLVENLSGLTTLPVTEPSTQSSTHEIVFANAQANLENLYQDLQNQSEKLIENLTNKQVEESSTDSSKTFTQTSGSIYNGTDTVAFETTSSNVKQNNADSLENPTQSSSENDFSTNATPEQRTYSSTDNDSTIVINSSATPHNKETQFISDMPITEAASQKPEQQFDLSELEVANNLNKGSYFKQSIDSFAEQLQDIGSGVSKTAADLVNKVEVPEVAQNSPNYPHISNDSSMEAEQPTEQPEQAVQPVQPSKHSHTFKETVDSFIAEVLDIGSNLNLRNKTEKKEQVLGTEEYKTAKKQEQSEQYEVNEVTSTGSSFAETEKPESILNASSTAENKSEIEQNLENLVGSASEFSSKFGKTVEGLWSVNGKEQENIVEKKAVTDEHLVGEVAQEASSTMQTLVEDTRNGKDVNLESVNAELGNSEDALPGSLLLENAQSFEDVESKNLNREIESASSKQDLNSTTQSSVEVESATNGLENSHQDETVSAGQELVPKTVSPLEVESVAHNSEFVSASEIQNISLNQEVENITSYPELASSNQDSQNTLSNSDLGSLKTETHSAHYEVIAPVAAVSSSTEGEGNTNKKLTEQNESSKPEGDEQQNLTTSDHHDSLFAVIQTPDSQNKLLESDPFFRTSSSENMGSHYNESQDVNAKPINPQEIAYTNEPITSSTTEESTTSTTNILEATTNAFNKFEDTLKTLISEETPATNLENTQLEMSTTYPAIKEEESLATSSTTALADETTILPKRFEEELQMAVKVLEQTTHQQFEEFQNNLKETFKKFTIFGGMEHEKSTESTTTLTSEITTQAPQGVEENTFSTTFSKENGGNATVQKTTAKSLDIVMKDSSEIEEPRSGAIHQEFVDTFDENPSTTEVPKEREQNFEISTSFAELPTVKHEALTLASSIESETKGLATTESSVVLTTLPPTDEEQQVQHNEDVTKAQPEETSFLADVKEDLAATDGEHNTTEAEATTTEVNIATTIPPYLERESLQEHVNHDVHNQLGEYNTEVVTTETQVLKTEQQQQQQHEQEQHATEEALEQESVEENHRELTQTDQPMAMDDNITTTATPETTIEQEMVQFVEHSDGTYNGTTEATAKQYKNEELDSTLATLQTQLPLTQPSFMEEQQQQIESTTADTAQTHTAPDVTTNDAVVQTTVADTTEATIYSTTVNEEVQEIETTTTPQELLEDTTILSIETVEAEARSLSLTPPKLEYLQSVDGVEVFYGYSIVKHN